jgi:hypothetical protein
MDMTLNETQRRLARHALGLPNSRKRSYRNRYFTTQKGEAFNAWLGMADRQLAGFQDAGSQVFFWLTRVGAEAALERGESLDTEDFPPGAA